MNPTTRALAAQGTQHDAAEGPAGGSEGQGQPRRTSQNGASEPLEVKIWMVGGWFVDDGWWMVGGWLVDGWWLVGGWLVAQRQLVAALKAATAAGAKLKAAETWTENPQLPCQLLTEPITQ
eukprot:Skav224834  [mRNA]  locus=scaffold3408:234895:235403:+ [translate_table: standard]